MAELASAIGVEAAHRLALTLGGTRFYVPAVIGEHHPIHAAIGATSAAALAECFGGARIYVPKQLARRERVKYLRRTRAWTVPQIARDTGYSERQIYRIVAEIDERQLDLFPE